MEKEVNRVNAVARYQSANEKLSKPLLIPIQNPDVAGTVSKMRSDLALQSGSISSAAADWSRFPIGTKFRIVDNNQMYVIDDYGPALVGTDTIDLYLPSRRLMDQWGSKRVTIEVFEKGSYQKSLEVLEPRQGNRFVRQMVQNIRKQNETRF